MVDKKTQAHWGKWSEGRARKEGGSGVGGKIKTNIIMPLVREPLAYLQEEENIL